MRPGPSLLSPLLLLLACGPSGRAAPADTVRWHADSHVVRLPDCTDSAASGERSACASAALAWVAIDAAPAPAVRDSFARGIEALLLAISDSTRYPTRDSLVAELFGSYLAAHREFPAMPRGWFEQRRVRVACNDGVDFVLRLDGASYTGGAHPISGSVFVSYDAATGALRDWRTRVDTAALRVRAEAAFRTARGLPASGSLNAEGWQFPDDRFTLPATGMRCGDTVRLVYTPYEVGPYVMGMTELVVAVEP